MGKIMVSEFITLDGVIGAPTFTFDYEFTDAMSEAMSRLTDQGSEAMLFGRTTWVESGAAWSGREMADDPGAPFFNNTPKYVVSATLDNVDGWTTRPWSTGMTSGSSRNFGTVWTADLRVWQRHSRAGHARRRSRRRAAPVALPGCPRRRPEALPGGRAEDHAFARRDRGLRQRRGPPDLHAVRRLTASINASRCAVRG